ncbi:MULTISPECIES: YwaF family protein [Bacillus]|uniref:YwaF family protein n=1 Tax=Bacillus TaxID=1386 RepID=UPI00026B9EEB|nr:MULTISPECIES: TIGR02206 family membrane protein [Bacillus]AIW30904.1 membrane protein [Bacillus subtilis]AZG40006.1 TIGR02206 family membrane protein [Bacillus velezensis]EJD67743.1 YwaF [Bacillus sp. 916]MBC2598968.1 TIGR02206 family membrane protein [Bacillus velezensis]MBU5239568.1 TIGR02206 family membrane protein [Bacillus velezensis]
MQKYFQLKSETGAFHLFSKEHIFTLLIIGLLGAGVIVFRKKLNYGRPNRVFRYVLFILLAVSQISYHIWLLCHHAWSLKTALPLQLSDLSVYLAMLMVMTKSKKLFAFLYFAGLGSAVQAMATPDLGAYSFPHFRYIVFFVSHGCVFLTCLFMAASERYRPSARGLWVSVLIVNLYGACVFFIDRVLNANYLYLMKKPKTASLLNVFGPWPWYLLSMEAAVILSFFILYIPFWLLRKRA